MFSTCNLLYNDMYITLFTSCFTKDSLLMRDLTMNTEKRHSGNEIPESFSNLVQRCDDNTTVTVKSFHCKSEGVKATSKNVPGLFQKGSSVTLVGLFLEL